MSICLFFIAHRRLKKNSPRMYDITFLTLYSIGNQNDNFSINTEVVSQAVYEKYVQLIRASFNLWDFCTSCLIVQ